MFERLSLCVEGISFSFKVGTVFPPVKGRVQVKWHVPAQRIFGLDLILLGEWWWTLSSLLLIGVVLLMEEIRNNHLLDVKKPLQTMG